MIISRETDYAIRMLRKLADGERHNVGAMCEDENIPQQFSYKILKKLERAGLVHNKRGKGGGCELTCDLNDVSVYDILGIVDNECYVNLCLTPGHVCQWEQTHSESCKVHHKLNAIQTNLNNQLKAVSLHALMFE